MRLHKISLMGGNRLYDGFNPVDAGSLPSRSQGRRSFSPREQGKFMDDVNQQIPRYEGLFYTLVAGKSTGAHG